MIDWIRECVVKIIAVSVFIKFCMFKVEQYVCCSTLNFHSKSNPL